uniref:Ig-like domain-containing protein n=1 Tax=Anser brachyrhynchus TaxID=132585 RepID=A0A8B9I2U0_9AVES
SASPPGCPHASLPASALLSALLPGMGRGTRETVLGTLGKATVLWIPQEFQDLTQRFGVAVWKRDTEDPHSKDVLLKYLDGNYTNYNPSQNRFHSSNFSLEILSTKRERGGVSVLAQKRASVPSPHPEPVSDPDIQVLSWALANDSCTVTLNCTAARGDNVSYSWAGLEASTSSPCAHNGSLLHLSYHLNATSLACACTASNPVSSSAVTFNSSACSFEQRGESPGTLQPPTRLFPTSSPALALQGIFFSRLKGGKSPCSDLSGTAHPLLPAQKQKIPCSPPGTEHPSCTTIYAAATGLPPDTAQAPGWIRHSPRAEPPTPQGRSPLSQVRERGFPALGTPIWAPRSPPSFLASRALTRSPQRFTPA